MSGVEGRSGRKIDPMSISQRSIARVRATPGLSATEIATLVDASRASVLRSLHRAIVAGAIRQTNQLYYPALTPRTRS